MEFSREDVQGLALLARLQLTDAEASRYQHDLGSILAFVGSLSNIDTSSVSERDQDALASEYRPDMVRSMADKQEHDAIIANFPDKVGDVLSVPAVFEKPKG